MRRNLYLFISRSQQQQQQQVFFLILRRCWRRFPLAGCLDRWRLLDFRSGISIQHDFFRDAVGDWSGSCIAVAGGCGLWGGAIFVIADHDFLGRWFRGRNMSDHLWKQRRRYQLRPGSDLQWELEKQCFFTYTAKTWLLKSSKLPGSSLSSSSSPSLRRIGFNADPVGVTGFHETSFGKEAIGGEWEESLRREPARKMSMIKDD